MTIFREIEEIKRMRKQEERTQQEEYWLNLGRASIAIRKIRESGDEGLARQAERAIFLNPRSYGYKAYKAIAQIEPADAFKYDPNEEERGELLGPKFHGWADLPAEALQEADARAELELRGGKTEAMREKYSSEAEEAKLRGTVASKRRGFAMFGTPKQQEVATGMRGAPSMFGEEQLGFESEGLKLRKQESERNWQMALENLTLKKKAATLQERAAVRAEESHKLEGRAAEDVHKLRQKELERLELIISQLAAANPKLEAEINRLRDDLRQEGFGIGTLIGWREQSRVQTLLDTINASSPLLITEGYGFRLTEVALPLARDKYMITFGKREEKEKATPTGGGAPSGGGAGSEYLKQLGVQ